MKNLTYQPAVDPNDINYLNPEILKSIAPPFISPGLGAELTAKCLRIK